MKNLVLLLFLLLVSSQVLGAVEEKIPANTLKLGDGAATLKRFEINSGLGASNPKIQSTNGSAITITKPTTVHGDLTVGDGTAVSRRVLVDRGGSNPFLKWDEATSSWVFSNNGSLEKKLGSGSGSGGDSGVNLLQNSSLEDAGSPVLNWSNTGGTFTQGTYTNGFEGDLKFGTFVSTTNAQFVQSDLITWPEFITDGGQYKIKYKNGNDAFKLQVLNSSAVLLGEAVLTNLANWQDLLANSFFAPVAGTQVRLRIVSTGAGTINFDKTYLGSNTNMIPVEKITSPPVFYTPVFTNFGTVTLVAITTQQIADHILIKGEFSQGTTTTGEFRMSLPPGMVIKSGVAPNSLFGNFVFGSNNGNVNFFLCGNAGDSYVKFCVHSSTTGYSPIATIGPMPSGVTVFTIQGMIPIQNLGGLVEQAQTTLQNDWFISANIGGASPILGTQSTFTAPSAATLDLVLNTGSASAKITCDGAEIASGLTCTANEQFGLSFNNVLTGWHTICAVGGGRLDSSSSTTFAFVRTANNSQTALEVANEKVTTQTSTPNTAPFQLSNYCAEFNFSAIAEQTIRFMYEADGGGSGSILADRNAALGSRDFHIKVMQGRFNQPRAILSGDQVTSPGTNKLRILSAYVSPTGVVSNEKGDLINGDCTNAYPNVCTFTSGVFSGTPNCWASSHSGVSRVMMTLGTVSNVSAQVYSMDSNVATQNAQPYTLNCIGE